MPRQLMKSAPPSYAIDAAADADAEATLTAKT